MSTTYPSTVQTFSDPLSTDTLSGHAALHTDINDTVEALQNKVGVDGDTRTSTLDKRVANIEAELTPVGSLTMFAGTAAPSGWLFCDGAEKSRSTYADLFAVIGTTYGAGNGSTTFNLPDLRNRAPVGAGSTYSLNQKFGATTDSFTIGSGNLPKHTHGLNNHTHDFAHTHDLSNHTHNVDPDETDTNDISEHVVNRLDSYITSSGPGTSFRIPDMHYDSVTAGMQVATSDFVHVHSTDIANTTSTGPSTDETGVASPDSETGGPKAPNTNTTDGNFANDSISVDVIQPSIGINFIIKV